MPSAEQLSRAGELLAESGLRSTRQRATVLAELLAEPDDVTAQQLHERLRARGERLGLATVYRTLGLLADEGVVDVLSHRPGELCYRLGAAALDEGGVESAEALLDPLTLPSSGLDDSLLTHYALPTPPLLNLPPRPHQRMEQAEGG